MPQVLAGVAVVGDEPVQSGLGRAVTARTLSGETIGGDLGSHGLDVGVGLVDLTQQILGVGRRDANSAGRSRSPGTLAATRRTSASEPSVCTTRTAIEFVSGAGFQFSSSTESRTSSRRSPWTA